MLGRNILIAEIENMMSKKVGPPHPYNTALKIAILDELSSFLEYAGF